MPSTFSGRIRFAIPNLFTVFAMMAGMYSIRCSFSGYLEDACWFILISALLDKADGILARALRSQSNLGAELDSFADFISFGIAPACVLECLLREKGYTTLAASHWGAVIYVVGAALRLARFNIAEGHDNHFTGVPSTMSGMELSLAVLTFCKYRSQLPAIDENITTVYSGLLFLFGMLMNSTWYFPKLNRSLPVFWRVFAVVNVLAAIACIFFRVYPDVLFGLGIFGVFYGPIYVRSQNKAPKAAAPKSQ
eukprot:GILI01005367.1.p1 GENE.GILI01005367.1~~GILI01005367.1.p1  ORF type:complete len:281 (+),score=59.90 GILI01005367.1:93-845(+)